MAVPAAIKGIADAIKEGFKLLGLYKKDKHVTRLRKAVDAGESYIRENTRNKPSQKLLKKYEKDFFEYNQG